MPGPLDEARADVGSSLTAWNQIVGGIRADDTLSAHGKRAQIKAETLPLFAARLDSSERAVADAEFARDRIDAELTEKAMGASDPVAEMRRREIRDVFSTLTSEQRDEVIVTAMRDKDRETLLALVAAPTIRGSLLRTRRPQAARCSARWPIRKPPPSSYEVARSAFRCCGQRFATRAPLSSAMPMRVSPRPARSLVTCRAVGGSLPTRRGATRPPLAPNDTDG